MNLIAEFGNHVLTVSPEDTIQEAAWKMKDQEVGSVVVARAGKEIVGFLTDRDIALKLALGEAKASTSVADVMTAHVHTIRANACIADAVKCFKSYQIKRLPIVNEDGELVGIVTFDDVMSKLAEQLSVLSQAVASRLVTKGHD
jgi:CBS domain-containing protein